MFKTAIFSVAALAVGAHSAGFWDEKDTKKSFISRVTLEEQCDLEASSFAVEIYQLGKCVPLNTAKHLLGQKNLTGLKSY